MLRTFWLKVVHWATRNRNGWRSGGKLNDRVLKYLAFRDYHAIITTSGNGRYEIHLYLFTTKAISRSKATRKDHTRGSRVEALLSPGYQHHIYGQSSFTNIALRKRDWTVVNKLNVAHGTTLVHELRALSRHVQRPC